MQQLDLIGEENEMMNMNLLPVRKAIVLGATGGMGRALVRELLERGIETVAFSRSRSKLLELQRACENDSRLEIVEGDAFSQEDVERASEGADVLFQSIGIPYPEWEKRLIPLTRTILQAAAAAKVRVIQIDNIYPYGRRQSDRITEDHPKQPHTRKGKLRLQMEEKLMKAHEAGTPVIIARFPDFYGTDAPNSMLAYTFSAIAAGKKAGYVGHRDIPREFIYLPDGAKAAVELAMREQAYGHNWNVPGPGVITGHEVIRLASEAAGTKPRSMMIGRGMMRLAGLFNPMMREAVEMLYLTEEPVILSGSKYVREIGPVPATPYEQAIPLVIRQMRKNIGQQV
jgi:nucleoside-diphosphate-sugar epimerase